MYSTKYTDINGPPVAEDEASHFFDEFTNQSHQIKD